MNKIKKYESLFKEATLSPEEEIINLFKSKDTIDDSDIHKLADELKIDTSKFEGIIYKLISDLFRQGKSKGKEKDFDPKEISMGMKVEMEHTSNPIIARKIVMDHLFDNDKYYSEGKAKGIFDELK